MYKAIHKASQNLLKKMKNFQFQFRNFHTTCIDVELGSRKIEKLSVRSQEKETVRILYKTNYKAVYKQYSKVSKIDDKNIDKLNI